MRRLVAIAVAGTLAAGSATAAESCPAMRARLLERCCCPPAPVGASSLTCCAASTARDAATNARDREPQPRFSPPLVSLPDSVGSAGPSPLATPAHAVLASAAGPPPLPLRI